MSKLAQITLEYPQGFLRPFMEGVLDVYIHSVGNRQPYNMQTDEAKAYEQGKVAAAPLRDNPLSLVEEESTGFPKDEGRTAAGSIVSLGEVQVGTNGGNPNEKPHDIDSPPPTEDELKIAELARAAKAHEDEKKAVETKTGDGKPHDVDKKPHKSTDPESKKGSHTPSKTSHQNRK